MATNYLTPGDLAGIQRAFENALRINRTATTPSSRGTPTPTSTSSPTIDTSGLTSNVRALGGTMSDVSSSMSNLTRNIDDNLDNFRRLSEVGSNFSNDIGVMTLSADMARTSMSEFSDVIINNNRNFAGLGGSVSRGTEVFAKMSNSFYDSGVAQGLRDLGYSTQDVNELLAQQLSINRVANYDDETSRGRLYKSTFEYGKELDKIAKLTGQNRKQITAELEDRKVQAQVQARLNIIRQTQGAEAAAKVEAEYRKLYAKAQAEGVGDMFLEMFATGGAVISEKAQQQFAMSGQGGSLVGEVATGLSQGVTEGADKKMADSQAAMAAQMNDLSFSTMVTLGGALSGLGETAVNMSADNLALSDSIRKAAQATDTRSAVDISTSEGLRIALQRVNADLENSATGYDEAGKQVNGLTKGMIDAQQGVKDLKAKVAKETLTPSKDGKSLMDVARAGGEKVSEGTDYVRQMEPVADKFIDGVRNATSDMITSTGKIVDKLSEVGDHISDALRGISPPSMTTPPAGTSPQTTTPAEPTQVIQPVQRRTGSWGMTGSVLEDFGEGTLAMLHNREGVVTESQLNELVSNAKALGMESMMGTLISSAKGNSFDISSIEVPSPNVTSNMEVNVDNTEVKQEEPKTESAAIKLFSKEISDMSNSVAQATDKKVDVPEINYPKILNDITTSIKFPDFSKITEQLEPPKIDTKVQLEPPETKVIPFDINMESLNKQKTTIIRSIEEITNGVESSINKQYDLSNEKNNNMVNIQQQLNDRIISATSTLNDVSFDKLNSSLSTVTGQLSSNFEELYDLPDIKIGDHFRDQITQINDEFKDAPKVDLTNVKESINKQTSELGDSFDFESVTQSLMDSTKPLQSTFGGILGSVFGNIQKDTNKYSVMINDSFGTVSNDINSNAGQFTAKIGKLFGDVKDFSQNKKEEPVKPTTAEIKQPIKEEPTSTTQIKPNLDSVDFFGPANKKQENKVTELETPKPIEKKKEEPGTIAAQKDNTDEIVKQLTRLNMQMGMLVSQHEELGKKQIRATNANSNNLFEH